MFEKEMRNLTYGLFVLSAAADGKSSGCIINTAMQVTDTPLKMAICVNKSSYTGQLIRQSRQFAVSILDEDADFEIFRHFGFQSGRDTDKFGQWKDTITTPSAFPATQEAPMPGFPVKWMKKSIWAPTSCISVSSKTRHP